MMRGVCSTCGSRVGVGEEFCGTCGAYLGWEKGVQPAPEPEQPAAPTDPTAEPDPVQPVAVQPAKPVVPRPESNEPIATVTADGPPCPACGTPNPPERRFCHRCAASLAAAAEPEHSPWWRRKRRPRDVSGLGWIWRRLAIIVLVAIMLVGAILLYPAGQWLTQDVLDKLSKEAPVDPERTVASAEVAGHPAENTVDLVSDSYWGAPVPGAWIEFTFDRPFRLLSLLVTPGPSRKPESFRKQARPSVLHISVTTADGQTHTMTKELADQPGAQEIVAGISDVKRVRVVTREATALTDGKHIAVGEIEFFRRS